MTGINPKSLSGTVVDDRNAAKKGKWTEGTGLKGYVAHGYSYAGANSGASIRFRRQSPQQRVLLKFGLRTSHIPIAAIMYQSMCKQPLLSNVGK